MFGTLRFILAWMVVLGHLWPRAFWVAQYAVFGFYLLSGYLMSSALTRSYPPTPDGIRRYVINRGLRIFPPYWAALLLATAVAWLIPDACLAINRAIVLPDSVSGWLRNIAILGLNYEVSPRLIPPAWSLSVELVFYVAMALGLARSRWLALGWLALSCAYTGYMVVEEYEFALRYYPILAASLPFALGATILHHADRLAPMASPVVGGGFLLIFAVNAVWPFFMYHSPEWPGDGSGVSVALWKRILIGDFYLSLFCYAGIVLCLGRLKSTALPSWAQRLDHRLGDLAYPTFLIHFTAAAVAGSLLLSGPESLLLSGPVAGSGLLFAASVPLVVMASIALHLASERPLQALRTRIRGRTENG